MTAFDDLLLRLGREIDLLPRRAMSALFLVCGRALLGTYEGWAGSVGGVGHGLLEQADDAAARFAMGGEADGDLSLLLDSMAGFTPEADSANGVSATAAQDCWICFDTAVRLIVDRQFEPGACIEFALQPVTEAVSERLFGVSQIGGGPNERMQSARLIDDAQFREALGFCEHAIEELGRRRAITVQTLDELVSIARLVPRST